MTRRSSARDKTLGEEEVGEEEEASSAPALSCLTDGITVGHIAFRPQTLRTPRILSVCLSLSLPPFHRRLEEQVAFNLLFVKAPASQGFP